VTSSFDVRVRSSDGAAVRVLLSGDIDATVADRLLDTLVNALEPGPPLRIEVDLAAVRLLDAAAIGVLLAARNRARSLGVHLHVEGATGLPRQVLEICGVLKLLAGDE
jgi:anti-anti-sigma factor